MDIYNACTTIKSTQSLFCRAGEKTPLTQPLHSNQSSMYVCMIIHVFTFPTSMTLILTPPAKKKENRILLSWAHNNARAFSFWAIKDLNQLHHQKTPTIARPAFYNRPCTVFLFATAPSSTPKSRSKFCQITLSQASYSPLLHFFPSCYSTLLQQQRRTHTHTHHFVRGRGGA